MAEKNGFRRHVLGVVYALGKGLAGTGYHAVSGGDLTGGKTARTGDEIDMIKPLFIFTVHDDKCHQIEIIESTGLGRAEKSKKKSGNEHYGDYFFMHGARPSFP